MEPTFPLFRLPENVIVHVLQNMNPDRLLIISLVSTKTKNLVTSLGLRARNIDIAFYYEINVTLHIGTFRWNLIFRNEPNHQNTEFDITRPISASCLCLNKPFQPSTPFNFNDWLDHILTVFCYTKPLAVGFEPGSEQFEMELLKNTLKNVDFALIQGVTAIRTKEILKTFKDLNKLYLRSIIFEDTCEVQKFFIQNFKSIGFHDVYSLDDMLSVNIDMINFRFPIPQKQFNRFVKHWIRGSNPRLQRMYLSINDSNSVNRGVLLKGIQCVDVSEEKQQEICQELSIQSDYMVEIKRKDGTPAVIAVKEYENNILHIRFLVFY
ncbi:hypothetical protein GCK72_008500 [Caenorhabditis remanei]|uniref:F-box domain-containing protein n=1 Tax=Caenorhabditis remanei TaxID=31234 RepID=A0A6A5H0F6_CAERE|nr:hypothetical protein GCK72_008500 [Caenorhabditis remanei]KAF1760254.1 hypothetical protein GCK72_008500 [Caenorhabditis remanei]